MRNEKNKILDMTAVFNCCKFVIRTYRQCSHYALFVIGRCTKLCGK